MTMLAGCSASAKTVSRRGKSPPWPCQQASEQSGALRLATCSKGMVLVLSRRGCPFWSRFSRLAREMRRASKGLGNRVATRGALRRWIILGFIGYCE
jgi:hypothetical protein